MNSVIRKANGPRDMETARILFREYADSLGIDLGFQNFESELAELPGKYADPAGCILFAVAKDQVAGCVALRPLAEGICEMKRLYLRPAFRGTGLGRLLATRVMEEARGMGYNAIRLDTMRSLMKGAIGLYRDLGFREIAPYCENPMPDAMFMERNLKAGKK